MDDKFEYFMGETNKKFDKIDEQFEGVNLKLDALISFRLLLIGGSLAISSVFSLVVTLLTLWLMKGG